MDKRSFRINTEIVVWKPLMKAHYLTRTDTIMLTRRIRFHQCRCFFNHAKTTDLFVIVDSSCSHCETTQCTTACFRTNSTFLLPTPDCYIKLSSPNSFGKSIFFYVTVSRGAHRRFFPLWRSLPKSKSGNGQLPASLSEWQTSWKHNSHTCTPTPPLIPTQTHTRWHLSCHLCAQCLSFLAKAR